MRKTSTLLESHTANVMAPELKSNPRDYVQHLCSPGLPVVLFFPPQP